MKWPKLVPEHVCTIPIKVVAEDGINSDGSPKEVLVFDGKCNYSEKSKQVLDEHRRLIRLSATALIDGDIAPALEDISGYVTVNNGKKQRAIFSSSRARNPDGTVNFTQLELM